MPTSSTQRAILTGLSSMTMPRASTTSAEPHNEDSERFPCLATLSPAPATTKAVAVDTLNVPEPDQLLDGLALHAKGGEEGGDLHVGGGAGHDRFHGAGRLDAREIPTLGERTHRLRDDGTGHGRVRSPASRGRMAEAASSTSPMLMGLASTECTPLASSSSWETSTAKPLTRITGRPAATVRTERASSHPVMPGMERSVNTRSS